VLFSGRPPRGNPLRRWGLGVSIAACLLAGAEVSARLQEECFDYFDAPIQRVAQKEVPLPYSGELEKLAIPQVPDIVKAVKTVMYLE